MSDLIFLCCPYTDKSSAVVEDRISSLLVVDAYLTKLGFFTISPLYKHLLVMGNHEIPGTWEYWGEYCKVLLAKCSTLMVIPVVGWEESTGVKAEMKLAKDMGVIRQIFPEDILLQLKADHAKVISGINS